MRDLLAVHVMIIEALTVVEGLYAGTKVTGSPGFSWPSLKRKKSRYLILIVCFGRAAKTSVDMVVRVKNMDTNINLTMVEEMSSVEKD